MGEANDVTWALELLRFREDEDKELISKYSSELGGLSFGVATLMARNAWLRRPLFQAPLVPMCVGVVTAGLAHLWGYYFEEQQALREAIFKEHIKKHPEDFPNPERMIGDLFLTWRVRR